MSLPGEHICSHEQASPAEPADLSFVDRIVREIGSDASKTIPLLQAIQNQYGHLPREALVRLSRLTEIAPAQIAGVSTFYTQFRHSPVGQYLIRVCHGTACHVKGSRLVHDGLMRQLGIADGGDTSPDGRFTVDKVACLGCCTLAPVIQIDNVTYGHLTADSVQKVLADFLELQDARRRQKPSKAHAPSAGGGEIRVGLGSCCVAKGSGDLHETFRQLASDLGIDVVIKRVGCVGMCHQTPLVEVLPSGARENAHLYARVAPSDAKAILLRHFQPRSKVRRAATAVSWALDHLLTDDAHRRVERFSIDMRDGEVEEFLGPQRHLATELCGQLDPLDIEEYMRLGGFAALRQCLSEGDPDKIIRQVTESGLRGRGGAGFPTGTKWRHVRDAAGERKYVICNGDEGDPGAFMDRMILESYPYRVIEGMIIAGIAVGAPEGIFYIRAEYPLAVERVREALGRCESLGLLGDNILGSGRSFRARIMEGAGAFVCGEETALLASIEGRRGMPRLRPPYPAHRGLWGSPTLVNNVETLALVPWIVSHGPSAFAALGTDSSKGTKVFALAGKIARGGLIEVPMGVTLRQVVEQIGGGLAGGRTLKAVQVGGPSGGCIPARLCDLPIDYEKLASAGAIMGSGGLVVLDDADCMVDIARYFLEFTQDQSCGKCTFCRVGTRRMLDILDRLCQGQGRHGDLAELECLARQVKASSLCGLGKTAPNPVLTTLEHFRDEYDAHLAGRCPAGRCKALIRYEISDDCIGCTKCAQNCPAGAIEMKPYEKHAIDDDKCIRCDTCRNVCPSHAVRVK